MEKQDKKSYNDGSYFLNCRIFYEINKIKTNLNYIQRIIDLENLISKIFNICIVGISFGVALLSALDWQTYVLCLSISLAIIAFLRQIFPYFILSLDDIHELTIEYSNANEYLLELQSLYEDFFNDTYDEKIIRRNFKELSSKYSSTSIKLSKIFGNVRKSLEKKAQKDAQDYLERIYKCPKKDDTKNDN